MSRHRSSSKKPPPEIGLHMECEEEELEPSQISYYNKAEKEYNEIQAKVDNYIKKMKAEVVEKGENCLVLQLNATTSSMTSPARVSTPPGGKSARQTVQVTNYQQLSGQGILTRSSTNSGTNTYLVMDSRLGFMVGQVQNPSTPAEQVTTSTPSKTASATRNRQQTPAGSVMVSTRGKGGGKKHGSTSNESETRTRQQVSPSTQQQQVFSVGGGASASGNYKIKFNAKPTSIQTVKPNESNAVGGLLAGGKVFKGTADDLASGKSTADSREVTFSKLTGKIFPSLVVVARPHLKLKYINQSTVQQERSALDAKVKGLLMYNSTKFIEWLIQQGLIRSEQICQTHINNDLTPVKLKLGMYSDVSKFPYSGGYVWISDCCPQQFVSVFSGSIFEGAPHPPATLLKLIYHWACQTNVQNVVQWVKVDNLYLKNFYTNMRAVCTQAVHEKFKKLGGPRKKIEVGVISLGTTSQDGNKRQVKVEVLGIMDQENKAIRLRAVEPLSEERSFKRRFVKILEPLEEWVHKESIILTDFTVAKAALNAMGFNSVYQVTNDSKLSNQNVMEYLRRIVPRMFQNTLSLLSRQIIQQFLDELVWREIWGPIPSQAFATIVTHLGEQTKLDVVENFLVRLNKVAANPFKMWNYSAWKPLISGNSRTGSKNQQKSAPLSQQFIPEVTVETPEFPPPGKSRKRKRAPELPLSDSVTPPVSAKKMAKFSAKDKQKKEDKAIKKEQNDKLTEEIIKFINEGKQIPLESYYYGSKKGDEGINHSATGHFNVKCCVCNKRFTDNIVLMKHLILHCQIEPALIIDLKKVQQCGHCFLGFNTSAALKVHLQEVHSEVDGKLDSNLLCCICEEKFNSRVDLIYHMHRTHVQLEMPYECGACRFRTSVYKVFVDHFIQVHQNEEHVFCPYCLKLVTFSYKGEPITTNVHFYMSHLEKHQRITLVKDCNRCQLSFIHKGILDQHIEADHVSWKNETGVFPLEQLPVGISMPEPEGLIKPSPIINFFRGPKTKHMFTTNKFKSLQTYGLDESMACVECESSLTFSEHFTGSFNCLKCRYASCCEKAMIEHFSIFHENLHPQFTKGKPIVLAEEMFCPCGFSTVSGNRIARHLALCERGSAYPSKEAALAAVHLKKPAFFSENSKQDSNIWGGKRKESSTQRKRRLEKARRKYREKRMNETEDARRDRLEKVRLKFASETEEQRRARLEAQRIRQMQIRKRRKGEGQNVLNMLGLVRKSPKVTYVRIVEDVKMETDEEEKDSEIEIEMKQELPETFSQEETDTCDSQLENSIILNMEEASKLPKTHSSEKETQLRDSLGKTQPEEVNVECMEVTGGEAESDSEKPTEDSVEIIDEKEERTAASLSKDNKAELSKNDRAEKEMEVDKCESKTEETNEETPKYQSSEQSKRDESAKAVDEMEIEEIRSLKEPDEKFESEEGNPSGRNELLGGKIVSEKTIEKISKAIETYEGDKESETVVENTNPDLNVNNVASLKDTPDEEKNIGEEQEGVVTAENPE